MISLFSHFTCRMPSEHTTGPTNPADLQDFFNRIFKGGPPNNMAANGGFFPSGPPHHQPPGTGGPPFSPPPSQTGFYMPGGNRTESNEPWAESGKPPRRRKKVRKPFQRWSLQTSRRVNMINDGHLCLLPAMIWSGEDTWGVKLQSAHPEDMDHEEEPVDWTAYK